MNDRVCDIASGSADEDRGEFDVGHQVVRASAGAGKTYALSNRYLGLVALGEEPKSILAATFTKKAAGEILGRVLTRLASAARGRDQAERLRQELEVKGFDLDRCRWLLARMVGSLHRLSVSTIDSFFYRVVSCYRLELGLGRKIELVSGTDPLAVELRRRAVDAVLGDGDLDTVIDLLRRIGRADAERGVARLIDQLVGGDLYEAYRQNPDPALWSKLETGARCMSMTELAGCIEKMRELAAHMPGKLWANAHKTATEAAQTSDWQTFLGKGIAKGLCDGDGRFSKKPIPAQIEAVYQPLIEHAVGALIDELARQTVATHRLMNRFERHYRRLRRERGVLLYSDLALVLHGWLSGADADSLADFYYRLDGRIAHLLLDEFQDTSTSQWDILRPLAREITAYADGTRSFFCVGDVKQAIYGWRGGCPEIFDQLPKELGLDPHAGKSLDRSYRTSQTVLDAVNTVFEGLPQNEGVAKVREHASTWVERFSFQGAEHRDRPGYVRLLTSAASVGESAEPGPGDDEQPNHSEPSGYDQFVADRIAEVTEQAPGCSIGVLTANNDQVRTLLLLLRNRQLAASGEGENRITDHPVVNTVLSVMTLADHPGHTLARFHAANSPLAGAIGLASDAGEAQAVAVGLRVRRDLASLGYAGTITGWAKVLARACDRQGVARLLQLIELADKYDEARTLRPSDFVRFIESATVQEQAPGAVRVMTVHKAKGLEFDAVVLPYLVRSMTRDGGTLVDVLRDSPLGHARAVYRRADQVTRSLHPDLRLAYDRWEARQVSDGLSKLYVAMTRPRYALYMVIPPLARTKKGGPKAEGWSTPSHAAILRHALSNVGEEESTEGNQVLYEAGDPRWAHSVAAPARAAGDAETPPKVVRLDDVIDSGDGSTRSWRVVTPSSGSPTRKINVPDLLRFGVSQAQLRGTVIHAWLAMIEWVVPGVDPVAAVDEREWLDEGHRVAPSAKETWLKGLIGEFRGMIEHPTVVRALSRPATQDGVDRLDLWRERAFAVRREHDLLYGIFDRVVVFIRDDRPVRAELTDFKTDRYDPAHRAELVERYGDQIGTYRTALSQMLDLPGSAIVAQLLFVGTDRCDRLPL